MPFSIRFLGTSAARPTVERGVSALAVVREGETLLFDCGEGTQRQMMRYGISFGLDDIFFTHTHSDHVLGLTGLLRTMALGGRTEPIRLWGPRGSAKVLRQCISLGGDRLTFAVTVTEIEAGASLQRKDYRIVTFPVDHAGTRALGYAVDEGIRLGRFNPERARELGVPEGPLWGRLHRGEAVTLPDGRVVDPAVLVGSPRRGRKVVLTGDTRPCAATIEAAAEADLLVHEATFATEELERARETGHSTAREAAEVAAAAGVARLCLTHLSARYSRDWDLLETEARAVFPHTQVARDGLEVVLPLPGDEEPAP
jgi:ribonuclease Z